MTHRRQNFMGGAAILALAVAVTKLLGALYKIPLGNLLDREGMAHFYAAYNIYSLLLVLSTAGLPVALSRMVARAAAQRRFGAAGRCLRTGLALLGVMGLACSAVMCLLP
ncbi:MAG TPA: polysaccharide biosynthesis protein, partial [Oscillibacter sp.]|nr:polysaccharide biosynthesis protein [Oscillibacter sp.]